MKVVVWITGILLSLILLGYLSIKVVSEPLPEPSGSPEQAEILADRMLAAIGKEAYDTLQLLAWSFPRGHHFSWRKDINEVTVTWGGEYKVIFYPDDQSGKAYQNGEEIKATDQKEALIQEAWALFANDSFWLIAPFKIRDPGTKRSIVNTDHGAGLLVTYESGGVTPGDSYLWLLDEDYKPKGWKMWVGIIPIGGLSFTWESGNYHQGVWLAPEHKGPGGFEVNLEIHKIQ